MAAGLGNGPQPRSGAKLALLALEGRIVTADAMHCQKATARTILDRGGDYVLALKGNQPALYEEVRLWLDDPATRVDDACQTVAGDHGRIETRRARDDVAWLAERHGAQRQLPALQKHDIAPAELLDHSAIGVQQKERAASGPTSAYPSA